MDCTLPRPRHQWTRLAALRVDIHNLCWDCPDASAEQLPIVLVAGLGCSSRYWIRLGPRLARRAKVFAPDLPGFGRSPMPPAARWPGGPNVREQADQLLMWMDARGINRAVLCGHSVGCQTAADLAARFPHRVERLILAAPTYERGHRTLASHLPRLLLGALVEAPSLTPLLIGEYLRAGLPRVVQQAVRTMADPIEAQLPKIAATTLVIRGNLDPLVRQGWAETVTASLRRASLVVIDGVGHAVQYSAAAVTAKVIEDFLVDRLDVAEPTAPGATVAPRDDPRHDSVGPPQPISPSVHGALDCGVAAVAIALIRKSGGLPASRRTLIGAAAADLVNNAVTARGESSQLGWPMVTHANVDFLVGFALLFFAAKPRARQSAAVRCITAAYGVYHILTAALTAKPTGPAKLRA